MTDDERDLLVRSAFHELAHAIVGRSVGLRVRRVDLTPSNGASASTRVETPNGMSPFEDHLARAVGLFAGEYGERIMQAPGTYVTPSHDDEGDAARLVARIANLPPAEAADFAAIHAESNAPNESDRVQAHYHVEQAGQAEWEACLDFCRARARRLVWENADLISALVPSLLAAMVWTRDELEVAIASIPTV